MTKIADDLVARLRRMTIRAEDAERLVEIAHRERDEERAARVKAEQERDAQKRRADNHWETMRSLRDMARDGDCERIILRVNDAVPGYVESALETIAREADRANAAEARLAEAYERAAKVAREYDIARLVYDSNGALVESTSGKRIADAIRKLAKEQA